MSERDFPTNKPPTTENQTSVPPDFIFARLTALEDRVSALEKGLERYSDFVPASVTKNLSES